MPNPISATNSNGVKYSIWATEPDSRNWPTNLFVSREQDGVKTTYKVTSGNDEETVTGPASEITSEITEGLFNKEVNHIEIEAIRDANILYKLLMEQKQKTPISQLEAVSYYIRLLNDRATSIVY